MTPRHTDGGGDDDDDVDDAIFFFGSTKIFEKIDRVGAIDFV